MPPCPLPSSCNVVGAWTRMGDVHSTATTTHLLSLLQDLLSYYQHPPTPPFFSILLLASSQKLLNEVFYLRQPSPKAAESLQQHEFISARCNVPVKFHHPKILTSTQQKKIKPKEISPASCPLFCNPETALTVCLVRFRVFPPVYHQFCQTQQLWHSEFSATSYSSLFIYYSKD